MVLSPVGMLLPVRLWGSSPSVASVVMMAVAPAAGCLLLPRRPVALWLSVASGCRVPIVLGGVTSVKVGVTITLVQLCWRLLPAAVTIG